MTSTLNLGTGDLNITLGNVSSGDSNNVNLGLATINANNITLNDSAGLKYGRVSILGDLNASSAINVTSTNKRINVGGASLTANGTGTAIDITSKYLSGNGSVSTPNGIWRATNTDTSSNGQDLVDSPETLSNMVILQAMLYKELAVVCLVHIIQVI